MVAETVGDLQVWECVNEPSPGTWCVTGRAGAGSSLAVNLYIRDGALIGAEISEGSEVITGHGFVPYRREV